MNDERHDYQLQTARRVFRKAFGQSAHDAEKACDHRWIVRGTGTQSVEINRYDPIGSAGPETWFTVAIFDLSCSARSRRNDLDGCAEEAIAAWWRDQAIQDLRDMVPPESRGHFNMRIEALQSAIIDLHNLRAKP